MYRYFGDTEDPKDETYQNIMEQLDGFIEHLPSEEDRQILSKMVSNSYYKYYEAIKSMERDDPSLIAPLIMALLVDQQLLVNRLKHHGKKQ